MPDTDVPRCSACGAPLDAPSRGGKIKCTYCRAVNMVDPQGKKGWDSIACPKCGKNNPKEALHCGHCGFKLKFSCPGCGALNPFGMAYCIRCGIDIQAELKRQEEARRHAQEDARLREEAMRRAQEEARRKQEEAARLEQEQAQRRWEEEIKKTRKQARITNLVIIGVVSIALVCIVSALSVQIYKANLSPQARQTRTAAAAQQTAVQQAAVARQTIAMQTVVQRTAVARQTIVAQTATAENPILFHDNFSLMSSGWNTYKSETSSASYERGGYRLQIFAPHYRIWANPPNILQNNVRIEVDATRLSEPIDSYLSIICRYKDRDNFNFLAIRNDGYALIGRYLQGVLTVISSEQGGWISASSFHTDSSNHIRADCVGSDLILYANGVQVARATDDSFQAGNKQVGLMIGAFDTGGIDILFDNFYVYRP